MSFIWNGVSSDTMKFNVTSRQVYNAPAYDLNAIEVPGRSGDLLNPQNRFKNKQVSYTGFLKASDFEGSTWREKLSTGLIQLKGWLCSDAGQYHELTDDYDPGFTRYGYISGETAISDIEDRPFGVTLTVTFNCKPFMYKAGEPMELPETKSASGSIITITDGAENTPLKSCVVNIEPAQSGSGDPSPTNVRPISGWTQVKVTKTGVNLCDLPFKHGIYVISTGMRYNHEGVSTRYISIGEIPIKGGQTYTISWKNDPTNTVVIYNLVFFSRGTFLQGGITGNPTFTAPVGADSVGITLLATTAITSISQIAITEPQLVVGSTDKPYAAPTLTPITIPLGQTVYGGTLDVLAGEGDSNLGSVTLDGTTLTYAHNGSGAGHTNALVTIPDKANGLDNIMSDRFVYGAPNQAGRMAGRAANNNVEFSLPIEVSTVAEIKAWFASNPTQLVYELAAPLEYDVSPQTIKTLKGTNNIWADAGEMSIEYPIPTENPYPFGSRPLYEITMAGTGTLVVNGKEWTITDYTGTLYCDTEAMEWYDASQLRNNIVSGDGWPVFEAGENSVSYTGDITKVMVTPRWRTL